MKLSMVFAAAGLGGILAVAACGGDTPNAADSATTAAPPAAATQPAGPAAAATGQVVEVRMTSNGGERFEPADVTVKRGDVVRFTLVSGVHNASFPAGKNPAGVTLPAASPYMTSAGQSHDVAIDLPAGTYHYQCDPHVAMGMVGTITVQD